MENIKTMIDSVGNIIYVGDKLTSIDIPDKKPLIELKKINLDLGEFEYLDNSSWFRLTQKYLKNSKWIKCEYEKNSHFPVVNRLKIFLGGTP